MSRQSELFDKVVKYGTDHGHNFDQSNRRNCESLIAFFTERIGQGVDDELLKLADELFLHSFGALFGKYECHLINNERSPDGKNLIILSGYDAYMALPGFSERIYSIDQLINFRVGHLRAFLKGEPRLLKFFLAHAERDPYLKKYVEPVTAIHQRLTDGEKLEDLIEPMKKILEELEKPNRQHLIKVFVFSVFELID